MQNLKKFFVLEKNTNLENFFIIDLISLIIPSVFVCIFFTFRIGFEDRNTILTLEILAITYFIILFPFFISVILSFFKRRVIADFIQYQPFFLFISLLLVIIISLISYYFNLLFLIVILGFIFLLYFLFIFIKNKIINFKYFFIIQLVIFFSIFILFSLWSSKFLSYYMSPVFYEKLFTGEAFIDPIFHGAVSNMIKNYGISSTGLDDTVYMPYHYLSHWVFAQFSKLLGINTLKFYEIGYPIIFITLFFKLFLMAIKKLSHKTKIFVKSKIFWLLLLVVFTGLFPKFILERFFISNSIIVSESYNLSIILVLFTFLMIVFFEEKNYKSKIFLYSSYAFFIMILPLLIFLIGLAKSSTMVIFIIVLFYLFIRYESYRKIIYNISAILTIIVTFLSLKITTQTAIGTSGFELFHFFNVVIQKRNESLIWPVTLIFFIILYFFWSILFIVLENRNLKINFSSKLSENFKKKRTIKMEVVIILCIAGVIPGIFIKIAGGSANYFSELQRWVSLVLLLAMAASESFIKIDIRKIAGNFLKFLAIILIIILLSSIIYNFDVEFKSFYDDYKRNKEEYFDIVDGSIEDELTLYRVELLKVLMELDKLTISEKSDSLIYIPVDNEKFWNLEILPKSLSVPMIVPAVSGIAMIYGLPDEGLIYTKSFGYSVYRTTSKVVMDKTFEELYFEISQKGYKNLVLLDYENGKFFVDFINGDNIEEYESYIYRLFGRLYGYCYGEEFQFEEIHDVVKSLKNKEILIEEIIPEIILNDSSLINLKDDKEFVESLYLILLDREADENGLKHWLSEIESGRKRMDIVPDLTESGTTFPLRFCLSAPVP